MQKIVIDTNVILHWQVNSKYIVASKDTGNGFSAIVSVSTDKQNLNISLPVRTQATASTTLNCKSNSLGKKGVAFALLMVEVDFSLSLETTR